MYCRFVVALNFWSWSIRKSPGASSSRMPPTPGGEKIALVWAMTTNALKPLCSTRLMRPVKPLMREWSQATGNAIGVSNRTPKS